MPTINENIKRLRLEKGMTLADVGGKIGVRDATIQRYESGEIKTLKYDTVVKLADVFGVSPSELMGWQDEQGAEHPHAGTCGGVRIPVLGTVAAGIPIEAVENVIDYEEIDAGLARTGEFFALAVRGASMEPVLFEGDIIIIRKQSTVDTGDVAVVLINGDEATVKKIRRERGGVFLIGYNTAVYEPHFYSNVDIEKLPVQILGKVIELRRKF